MFCFIVCGFCDGIPSVLTLPQLDCLPYPMTLFKHAPLLVSLLATKAHINDLVLLVALPLAHFSFDPPPFHIHERVLL